LYADGAFEGLPDLAATGTRVRKLPVGDQAKPVA
jgi:hypothetical protein